MTRVVGRFSALLSRPTVTAIGAFEVVMCSEPEVLKVPVIPALDVLRVRSDEMRDYDERVLMKLGIGELKRHTSAVMTALEVCSFVWPAVRD
jgi:hypothetical protein